MCVHSSQPAIHRHNITKQIAYEIKCSEKVIHISGRRDDKRFKAVRVVWI